MCTKKPNKYFENLLPTPPVTKMTHLNGPVFKYNWTGHNYRDKFLTEIVQRFKLNGLFSDFVKATNKVLIVERIP